MSPSCEGFSKTKIFSNVNSIKPTHLRDDALQKLIIELYYCDEHWQWSLFDHRVWAHIVVDCVGSFYSCGGVFKKNSIISVFLL